LAGRLFTVSAPVSSLTCAIFAAQSSFDDWSFIRSVRQARPSRQDVTAVNGSSIGIAVPKDGADDFREDVMSAVPGSIAGDGGERSGSISCWARNGFRIH
jgi:hypothetical protein